jgi:hypothetical protein
LSPRPKPSNTAFTGGIFVSRDISSAGLERLLDRQEVTGSNPVCLTKNRVTYIFFVGDSAFSAAASGFTSSKSALIPFFTGFIP